MEKKRKEKNHLEAQKITERDSSSLHAKKSENHTAIGVIRVGGELEK